MVVRFYVSMISGNKEMKKQQMKAQLIMESKGVEFKIIDIADPNNEAEKRFMQNNADKKGARNPIPPQFFQDRTGEEEYCGDYPGFDHAVETDTIEEFLKLPKGSLPQVPIIIHELSEPPSREVSVEKEINGHEETVTNGVEEPVEEPMEMEPAETVLSDDPEETQEPPVELQEEREEEDAEVEEPQQHEETEDEGAPEDEPHEEEQQEKPQERDEEEEETSEPEEEDLMEMSTTVATAERFTEFSYKQLPGEA